MTDPLDLCQARIHRAAEHIHSLRGEVPAVLAECGRPLPFGNAVDGPLSWSRCEGQLEARLCLMIGEVVYNLRAALDHIVWELASKGGKSSRTHVAFPVCDNPEHFKQVVNNGILKGVPRKYYPQIASFQPYLTPDPPNAVLRLLDDLATNDLRDMAHLVVIAVPPADAAAPDDVTFDLAFTTVGSFQNAPVLPVLGYLKNGVQTIALAFEKYLRSNA